ncbi:Nn.00g027890.m01.CDS01 [Neocucurbitaria sp. VM-36]
MDSDSQRLPAGFVRIGYDADDETYTFRGPDGRIYESEPGCKYGNLWPAGEPRPQRSDAEIEANNEAVKKDNREATRMMLPFALLIFVFLILLFKLINRPLSDHGDQKAIACAEGSHQVQIRKGDTCWAIAEKCGLGVDELLSLGGNEKVDCDSLGIGQRICVPESL